MSDRPHRHGSDEKVLFVFMETYMLKAFQNKVKRKTQQVLNYYSVLCSALYHKHGLV